jgi:hypothetical protein
LAGETEVPGGNLSQRHFVHHKSHLPEPGSNPGRRDGKSATNRFSYGAASHNLLKKMILKLQRIPTSDNRQCKEVEHMTFLNIKTLSLWYNCSPRTLCFLFLQSPLYGTMKSINSLQILVISLAITLSTVAVITDRYHRFGLSVIRSLLLLGVLSPRYTRYYVL